MKLLGAVLVGALLGGLLQACWGGYSSAQGNCGAHVGLGDAYDGADCPAGLVMTGLINGQLICSPITIECY